MKIINYLFVPLLIFLAIPSYCQSNIATNSQERPNFRAKMEEEFAQLQQNSNVGQALRHYIDRYNAMIAQLNNAGADNTVVTKLEMSKKRCAYDLNNYSENSPGQLKNMPQKGPRSNEFIENMTEAQEALWEQKNKKTAPIVEQPRTIQNIEKPINNLSPEKKETVPHASTEPIINEPVKKKESVKTIQKTEPQISEKQQSEQPQGEFTIPTLTLPYIIALMLLCLLLLLYLIFFFLRYRKIYNYAKNLEADLRDKEELLGSCDAAMRKIHSNILNINRIPTEKDLHPDLIYSKLEKYIEKNI